MRYSSMTTPERFKELRFVIRAIQDSTTLIPNHPDPRSVGDCWAYMDEILQDLEDHFKQMTATGGA